MPSKTRSPRLAKDTPIADALDRYIAHIEEPREPDGRYHPSSFWLCGRATILAVRGVEVSAPPTAEDLRVFRIGHILHELTQKAMSYSVLTADSAVFNEFGVDIPDLNIAGHGDTLRQINEGPMGDFEVVEYKSTKSLYYTPKEDHLKQASIYAVGAHDFGVTVRSGDEEIPLTALGDRLKGVRLVYLDKVTMEIREYWYPYRTAWRDQIEKRVRELDHYRRIEGLEELPPVLPLDNGKPNWYLGYCNYRGSGFCCADEDETGGF